MLRRRLAAVAAATAAAAPLSLVNLLRGVRRVLAHRPTVPPQCKQRLNKSICR